MLKERSKLLLFNIIVGLAICGYYVYHLVSKTDPFLKEVNFQQNLWGLIMTGLPLLILLISFILKKKQFIIGALLLNLGLICAYTIIRFQNGFELFNHILFVFIMAVLVIVGFIGFFTNKKTYATFSLYGGIMYLIYLIVGFIYIVTKNVGSNPIISELIKNNALRIVIMIVMTICFAVNFFVKKKIIRDMSLTATIFLTLAFVFFGNLIYTEGILGAARVSVIIYIYNLLILGTYVFNKSEDKLL